MNPYAKRNMNLKLVGFESYALYLQSPLWKSIRQRVFAVKGRLCWLCQASPATQVHHLKYSVPVLQGRKLKWLAPVCGGCHEFIEDCGGLPKRISAVNRRLKVGRKECLLLHEQASGLAETLLSLDLDQIRALLNPL